MPNWVPRTGLIRDHYDYGVWATDATPIYHVASMLTSLAAVCADQALLVIQDTPYPLHVWSMLVGASTRDRKTTSARMAIERVSKRWTARVMQIYGSPEAAMVALKTNPCAAFYVPEGQAFFEQREAGYWKHARGMFMDLYDYKKQFVRQLVKESVVIENPRVSILAACARPLLERYSRDTDWLGGFLARFLMVSGKPLSYQAKLRTDLAREKAIEDQLNQIFMTKWGTLGCTSGASDILDDFAREIHEELDAFPIGIQPSLLRLPEMAKRFAALYEISIRGSNPDGKIALVGVEAAECAVALCRASRDDALMPLADLTTSAGWHRDNHKVESLIRQAGPEGISRSALIRRTRIAAQDLERVLRMLFEADLILAGTRRDTPGRPASVYTHVEAETDAKRRAQNRAVAAAQRAYISLNGGPIDISALPVSGPFGPDVVICDEDELDDDYLPN